MEAYFDVFNRLEGKLGETLEKLGLTYVLDCDAYPITLTVVKSRSDDDQMGLFDSINENNEGEKSSLKFIFRLGDLEIQTSNRLSISASIMNKIKSMAQKIHAAYVHAYFASTMERAK